MIHTGQLLHRATAMSAGEDGGPGLEGTGLDLPPIEPRQLAIGAGVIVVGLLLAKVLRVVVRWWLARKRTLSYARVFSTLAAFLLGALAVGAGLTVAFPSVQPVDILGGLGIASVAIGIAFQNVLANLFAGVLILVREPFRAGDQIAVGDVRGTVEEVNLRETVVRTFDGRRVLVPNSTVHGEVLTVQTGYTHIRTTVVIGVDYSTDLARARSVVLERGPQGARRGGRPGAAVPAHRARTLDDQLRPAVLVRCPPARDARDARPGHRGGRQGPGRRRRRDALRHPGRPAVTRPAGGARATVGGVARRSCGGVAQRACHRGPRGPRAERAHRVAASGMRAPRPQLSQSDSSSCRRTCAARERHADLSQHDST